MKLLTEYFNSGTVRQQNKKRLGALLICATAILLCIALIVLMVASIATAIKNRTPAEPVEGEETGSGLPNGYTTTTVDPTQLSSGNLLLIDGTHPFVGTTPVTVLFYGHETRPQTESGSVTYTINGTTSLAATEATVTALNEMLAAFYAQSKTTDDPDGNDNLWIQAAFGSPSSNPIYMTGYAVALNYKAGEMKNAETIFNQADYKWIYDHAADYGFVRASDLEGEENIFRYVGVAHATYMEDREMTLSAYLDFVKTKSSPNTALREGSYRIYYQPAGESIIVPSRYAYEISGNNVDGYIITVDTSTQVKQ